MDAGARASTTTFVENKQGDVLLAWENEAKQIMEHYPGEYEIVMPSVSIVAEPSVAVVAEIAKNTAPMTWLMSIWLIFTNRTVNDSLLNTVSDRRIRTL